MTSPRPPLSADLLRTKAFGGTGMQVPHPSQLELPLKAVQFGTGAFLRGFIEAIVDDANRAGTFNGRIAAIGSTGSGRDDRLNDQDGLYTLAVQGMHDGAPVHELRVVASLERAISAQRDWAGVVAVARVPSLDVVFSNTTEVGIALDPQDCPDAAPPRSFPGKLTRFLHERATAVAFAPDKGLVVLPCELIENNGGRLRDIVLELASRWHLGREFRHWVERSVVFCNTLVDRIVPGAPTGDDGDELRRALPYADEMLTICEPYRLFAIEGDDLLRERLGFGDVPGVIVASDITPYRERKVRLLNGAHTAMVSAALLAGCETVREAVEDDVVGAFFRRALFDEIVPSVSVPQAEEFAREVVDRFRNPYIRHALFDITLQGTMKVRVRVVPSIIQYARKRGRVPAALALGFAAFVLFARGDLHDGRRARGEPVPPDDNIGRIRDLWTTFGSDADAAARVARATCADSELWGADLTSIQGFSESVAEHLAAMEQVGVRAVLQQGARLAQRT